MAVAEQLRLVVSKHVHFDAEHADRLQIAGTNSTLQVCRAIRFVLPHPITAAAFQAADV